jgi:hypothetical protein
MRIAIICGFCLPLILTGCSSSPQAAPTPEPGFTISGIANSGQQTIGGGHVYLYTPGTNGYGQTAVSLLNSSVLTNEPGYSGQDSNGNYYVITNASGNFTITSDYNCTSGQPVYAYLTGGNSGGGANSAIGLLAVLGDCTSAGNFDSITSTIYMNEASTIAAAYAMAGFATDATHVSSSGTALAKVGMQNAFVTASNLASLSTGIALATTPAGNGTVPQTEINTMANILASCINSTGPAFPNCATLFSDARSAGSSGTTPADTATAAINLAHNPASNLAGLYVLSNVTPLFAPALSAQPNDLTLALNFTGGGLNQSEGIAIDGSGNAWVANKNNNSVTELNNAGTPISPSTGYTGGRLEGPLAIAIDGSGNAWVANDEDTNVTELNNAGAIVSGSNGYTGGGLFYAIGIAIAGSGNAWVANDGSSITELNNAGTPISPPSTGYTGGGLTEPEDIAIDGSGNVWIPDYSNGVVELSNAGTPISPSYGYRGGGLIYPTGIAIDGSDNVWVTNNGANGNGNSVTELNHAGTPISSSAGYTGGGLNAPWKITIDGSGNAWVTNHGNGNSITELNNAGTPISPSTGYTGGGLSEPDGITIDGSGNVWVANYNNSVTEFVGAAIPVVTPMVANLLPPYGNPASKP